MIAETPAHQWFTGNQGRVYRRSAPSLFISGRGISIAARLIKIKFYLAGEGGGERVSLVTEERAASGASRRNWIWRRVMLVEFPRERELIGRPETNRSDPNTSTSLSLSLSLSLSRLHICKLNFARLIVHPRDPRPPIPPPPLGGDTGYAWKTELSNSIEFGRWFDSISSVYEAACDARVSKQAELSTDGKLYRRGGQFESFLNFRDHREC